MDETQNESEKAENPGFPFLSFVYRGVSYQRTVKGYWFFDNIPPCGNAWERYGTDEETHAISDNTTSIEAAIPIMHRMIDRMLDKRVIYKGDLRYRQAVKA